MIIINISSDLSWKIVQNPNDHHKRATEGLLDVTR